jgi:hypothetical protein
MWRVRGHTSPERKRLCAPLPIQARSVSDGVSATIDATPCVASDPPAYAEGFYGERERRVTSRFSMAATRVPGLLGSLKRSLR